MTPFVAHSGRAAVLPVANIDTDQIIPARFLKVTDKAGLGQNLFADWRYLADGEVNPEFVINRPENQGAQILLAGDNFGCGSSREHAPWALTGWGIRTVISTSFGDIFANNALKNGLLPVVVDVQTHSSLFDIVDEMPAAEWTVDLEAQTVTLPTGHTFSFKVDPFARACLLQGVDELGYILSFGEQIAAFETSRQ
jgi:3-isopropylmalate/(R)-2-methylmalate dehydratase small subunit